MVAEKTMRSWGTTTFSRRCLFCSVN